MRVFETKLKDCLVIEPKVFGDKRGFFYESFQAVRYREEIGISLPFVQDNVSKSRLGVLRGLHFQINEPQGKLVSVFDGEVFDVVLDIRPNSASFGHWESFILSEKNNHQLWVPPGFAHGFQVLSESATFSYKCTNYYNPKDEGHIFYGDPTLNISWPLRNPIVSDKDASASSFEYFKNTYGS